MYRKISSILFILIPIFASAQNIEFRAETDAVNVVENGIFEVSYVLENADGSAFQQPNFSPFKVVAGPSRSMNTTIINGAMSKSMSFTYALQAGRPGKYTIPAAVIRVNGREIKSNALLVEVVRGSGQSGGGNDIVLPEGTDVFLAAEPDTTTLYPGQQVQLNYTLYSTLNVRNYSALSEDDYGKYYLRYVKDFNDRPRRVVFNGTQYQSQTLKSIALFPQQLGRDTIDPYVVRLGIGVNDPNNGFFFSMRTVPKNVQSRPVVFDVKPLPDSAPQHFTGAVGQYLMHVQIDKRQLSTDDALVVLLQVQGNGDARRWEAPELDHLKKDFEIYPPKTILDRSKDQNGVIINEKRFEYLLIPKTPSRKDVSLAFSYFDPETGEYRTLNSDTFQIQVIPGSGTGDLSEMLALHEEVEHQELRDIKKIESLSRHPVSFFGSIPYYLGFVVPMAGMFFLFLAKSKREEFAGKSSDEKRKLLASKKAKALLSESRKYMETGDASAFYEAVSIAITGYLAGKMKIPNSDLSRENMRRKMEEHGFPVETREKVMQIMEELNFALYSGRKDEADLKEFYQKAAGLFVHLESHFKE